MIKVCSKCGKEKDVNEFPKRSGGKPASRCKTCTSEYHKSRYKNKEGEKERHQLKKRRLQEKKRRENPDLICPKCNKLSKDASLFDKHLSACGITKEPGYSSYDKHRSESYQDRKNEFLGCNHSTASHHLKRRLFFKLLVETNQDSCFRCGLPLSEDDWSVDHKKDWLWVDPSLFHDLDNIAYSHRSCNSSHSRSLAILSDVGFKWCGRCKKHLAIDAFPKTNHGKAGSGRCTQCRSEVKANWREKTGKH